MSDQLLTILKFFLLALVWLFFLRVLRAVWVEIRSSDAAEPAVVPAAAPAAPARRERPRRRGPSRLKVVEPADRRGRVFDLADEMTVGRSSRSGIALEDDTFVSSTHARLYFSDDKLWVEDLGSTNGTYVNSSKVSSPVALRKGDRVQIGNTVMEVAG